MKPYYQDDLVTIYHGDSLALGLSIETRAAIVTDPPYGINATTTNRSRGRGRYATAHDWPPVYGDGEPFDPSPWLQFPQVILFGANHYADRLPPSSAWFVWDKRLDLGMNDSADCEMAWTNLGGPARMFRHRWQGMVRDSERGESYHPTQKPVALMRWCIERTDAPLVIDPFMGSGSTLVAAKSIGRKAIGIEVEERYCELAALRCSQETLGLSA